MKFKRLGANYNSTIAKIGPKNKDKWKALKEQLTESDNGGSNSSPAGDIFDDHKQIIVALEV